MPINTIPPWLNIQPTDFLQATQQGTAAGINVAELRQRAAQQAAAIREAQARRAQEAWEAGERMRFAAQQQAARLEQDREEAQMLAEYRRGQLAQSAAEAAGLQQYRQGQLLQNADEARALEDYRQGQLTQGELASKLRRDRLEETARHNKAMEQGRSTGLLTPTAALGIVSDPMKYSQAKKLYGDSATNLVNIAQSGFAPQSQQPTAPVDDALRTQAHAAIAAGAPEAAVRARYKQMTGKELD